MKKLNKYCIKIFCFLLISMQAIGQTETFDIIIYNPPKDWKKDAKQGVVNYLNANETRQDFKIMKQMIIK